MGCIHHAGHCVPACGRPARHSHRPWRGRACHVPRGPELPLSHTELSRGRRRVRLREARLRRRPRLHLRLVPDPHLRRHRLGQRHRACADRAVSPRQHLQLRLQVRDIRPGRLCRRDPALGRGASRCRRRVPLRQASRSADPDCLRARPMRRHRRMRSGRSHEASGRTRRLCPGVRRRKAANAPDLRHRGARALGVRRVRVRIAFRRRVRVPALAHGMDHHILALGGRSGLRGADARRGIGVSSRLRQLARLHGGP